MDQVASGSNQLTRHNCFDSKKKKEEEEEEGEGVGEAEDDEGEVGDDDDLEALFDTSGSGTKLKFFPPLDESEDEPEPKRVRTPDDDDEKNDDDDENNDDDGEVLVKAFHSFGQIMVDKAHHSLSSICMNNIIPQSYDDESWDGFITAVEGLVINDNNTQSHTPPSSTSKTPPTTPQSQTSSSPTSTKTPPQSQTSTVTPKRKQTGKGGPMSVKRQKLLEREAKKERAKAVAAERKAEAEEVKAQAAKRKANTNVIADGIMGTGINVTSNGSRAFFIKLK